MANKPRKTIDVAYVVGCGNHFLKHSEDEAKGERRGVANMIELVLHDTNNYRGFRYIESAGLRKNPTFNEAWDRYRAIIEILTAGGMTGSGVHPPEWDDYCADDTRREYTFVAPE